MNVAHLLTRRVQAHPEGRALVYTRDGIDRVLSFAQVEQQCDEQAHGLRIFGLRPGDRVLLLERPGPNFITLAWALFKLGCIPVLLDPGMGVGPLLACVEKLKPDALIGVRLAHWLKSWHRHSFASVRRSICTEGRWLGASPLWRVTSVGAGPFSPVQVKPDQLAAILYTSGSTGPAKGVEYRHSIFWTQVEALGRMFDFRPGQVDMPGFPLFALFSNALGMTSVLPQLNPSRPARVNPAALVRAIQDWQVETVQGSPAIWDKLGRYCRDFQITLPSLRKVITFGAPVPLDFLEMWRGLLGPGGEVYTPYGATEALPVSLIRGSEVLSQTSELTQQGAGVCLGQPVDGLEVAILDEQDQLLPPGEIGQIVVSGPQVTWAYFQDPEATQASKLQREQKLWHRMGDLGYFDESGRLWIVGRLSHRVQSQPQEFLYPVAAEGMADQHPEVLRSALVGLGKPPQQKPALVIQLARPSLFKDMAERNRIAREVRQRLAQHPLYAQVKTILFHRDFPVDPRHNAKIDREALAQWGEGQRQEAISC